MIIGDWFHHIGLACASIEAELPHLAALGYALEGPFVEDPIQKVVVCFLTGGGPRIELIQPTAVDSPVQGILKRRQKLYHLAYQVVGIDAVIGYLEARGFRAIGPAAPAAAFGMRRIIFMMSDTLNLIELIEA